MLLMALVLDLGVQWMLLMFSNTVVKLHHREPNIVFQHSQQKTCSQINGGCTILQAAGSWQGYLVAAADKKQAFGSSTVAQDLLRKRYVGISGSNKIVGALEIQQVWSPGIAADDAASGRWCTWLLFVIINHVY